MKLLSSKPLLLILVAVVVFLLVFTGWMILAYNGFVARQQTVQAQWAQVENQYQRKIDLIPELVSVAYNYTQFERSVLENITRLRSQWQNATSVEQQINYTNSIDQNLYVIRITYEAYPELQSATVLVGLMDELAGTENRITVERSRFNDAVRSYNTQVRSFPDTIIAGWFGFHEYEYYNPLPGGP
ncbi:MAG TPA: LemA family protein [Thermoplasmata archaeon]|jgi:LemA protein